ncbi:YqzM family protein [Paenibacillus sp. NPDC056579]|nr:YqzM family protein [Paenibacillus sp. H1-7]ULL18194.1 YqzM family protein [Paenibacillus sp. H1-7]
MNDPKHPELHVMEEPTNDFLDVAIGFGAFFGVMLLMGVVATVIQIMTR